MNKTRERLAEDLERELDEELIKGPSPLFLLSHAVGRSPDAVRRALYRMEALGMVRSYASSTGSGASQVLWEVVRTRKAAA